MQMDELTFQRRPLFPLSSCPAPQTVAPLGQNQRLMQPLNVIHAVLLNVCGLLQGGACEVGRVLITAYSCAGHMW